MRIFVTGAGGFAGRWLARELEAAGHRVATATPDIGGGNQAPRLDVLDAGALRAALAEADPEAIVHLAAVSAASEAAARPDVAFAVAVGGTVNLLEAVRAMPRQPHLLIVGSSEVYGAPALHELPLNETSALRPQTPYALSKVAQESVALAYAARMRSSLVVVRSFNHIGPGQRPAFVVPALARRIRELRDGTARDIPVGNLHVRRDFTDVRDVVRAYRLLLEALANGDIEPGGRVFNVASGETVSIRQIVELLARAAGIEPVLRVDPELVRSGDPAELRGDATALRAVTGWRPEVPLSQTLADVWRDAAGSTASGPIS